MWVEKNYLRRLTFGFLLISVSLGGLAANGAVLGTLVVGATWVVTAFNVIKYSRAYVRQLEAASAP
ncbi:hypothetical protein ACG98H_07685 [Corynebacterium sp. L4756]|uniref:hypothetical protein n=1 Tax=unclassified Corynebacterium TaxID=2624378 RepID=UPI00374CFCB1